MNVDKMQYSADSANAHILARRHILAIDDDPMNREVIVEYLGQNDLRVTAVPDGPAMQSALEDDVVDVVLLDLKRRTEDGMTLLKRLHDLSAIPVIILTDRADEADKVMGLEMGAADYVTRPFSLRELLARIRALLRRQRLATRRGRPEGVRAYRFDGWQLNLGTRRLTASDGQQVPLTNGEFSLLVALLGSPQRVLTRDQLLDLSRLHNDDVFNRSIDVQIGRLRRKIESDPARPHYVKTERGFGYVFSVPVETISYSEGFDQHLRPIDLTRH
jgi:DNA-binding response OmpR family regulator